MNLPLLIYKLTHPLFYALVPLIWVLARTLGRGSGRLVRVISDLDRQANLYRGLGDPLPGERVWLQAASVGEVAVAAAVVRRLLAMRPGVQITVSSSTGSGLATARRVLGQSARVIPYPLDLGLFTRRAVKAVQPHVYAAMETELWPDLLHRLAKGGTGLLLLNGRIGKRSFGFYRRTRPLWKQCLGLFNTLSMISFRDARRAVRLGAPTERTVVGANAKYDGMAERADAGVPHEMAERMALGESPLLVAGSVRGAEMGLVVEALAEVLARKPEAVAALAPRHVENSAQWAQALDAAGLPWEAFSDLSQAKPRTPQTQVVLVDTIGDLFDFYGLAAVALVGGSLAPLGGHNPMEPAAWGTPVVFGRSMEDFPQAARALVDAGGAARVDDKGQLIAACVGRLDDPQAAAQAGQAARGVLDGWPMAADEAAGLICRNLDAMGNSK